MLYQVDLDRGMLRGVLPKVCPDRFPVAEIQHHDKNGWGHLSL
jgi:hypothetical protein